MAEAAIKSAILNVEINLESIKDEKYVKETQEKIKKINCKIKK